jgi:hypothetical protein
MAKVVSVNESVPCEDSAAGQDITAGRNAAVGQQPADGLTAGYSSTAGTPQVPIRKFRQCQVCGTKNYVEEGRSARACRECGNDELYKSPVEEELQEDSPGEELQKESPDDNPSAGCRKLFLESLNDNAGIEIPPDGGIIGKCGTIQPAYFLNKRYVSKEHAFILHVGDRYIIKDMKSKNRTWMDGVMLEYGAEYELKEGSVIRFADVSFLIRGL